MRIILKDRQEQITACIEEYSGLILSICYSMTKDRFEAEDLAQETFISAFRNMDSFDGRNLKGWLTTIAANKCRDYLKSAARRTVAAPMKNFQELRDGGSSPEEALLKIEAEKRVRSICDKLREPYRSTAKRHFCDKKGVGEIAEETGKNVKTVQTHLYRARAMLKDMWKEEYD